MWATPPMLRVRASFEGLAGLASAGAVLEGDVGGAIGAAEYTIGIVVSLPWPTGPATRKRPPDGQERERQRDPPRGGDGDRGRRRRGRHPRLPARHPDRRGVV